jgi:hypothetical protein
MILWAASAHWIRIAVPLEKRDVLEGSAKKSQHGFAELCIIGGVPKGI